MEFADLASGGLAEDALVITARTLDAARILAAAREHDERRLAAESDAQSSAGTDDRLAAALGFALPDILLTPFQRQAGVLAYNAGIVAFERMERAYPEPPAAWLRHDLQASQLRVTRLGFGVYGGHTVWPFRQDGPLADYSAAHPAPWLAHACIHTLLGGVYWPDLSEYELLHAARLSEVLAAWHWYWLTELGHETCDIHSNFDGVEVLSKCAECSAMAAAARDPEERARRLQGDHAAMVAANAVSTLRYEVHAYWHGLLSGHVVIPQVDVLDHGEAADYARFHHRRMISPSQRCWVEHCLTPQDYGTSPQAYAHRASELIEALMRPTPLVSAEEHGVRRAVRVLQDLGQRVADFSAVDGGVSPAGEKVVARIGQLIAQIRPAANSDWDVAAADHAVAEALGAIAADLEGYRAIVQVGYRPTLAPQAEPQLARAARREAYLSKLRETRSPWAPFVELSFPEAIDMMIDGPRQMPLSREVANGVFAAAHLMPETVGEAQTTLAEYLQAVAAQWGPEDGTRNPAKRWYYRLAPEQAPSDVGSWGAFRVRPNPNMGSLGSPFVSTWMQRVIDGEATPSASHDDETVFGDYPGAETVERQPYDPRSPRVTRGQPQFVLMGMGRRGPIFLPYTPTRARLLDALQHTPTLAELLEAGHREDDLRQAVAEEMVVLIGHNQPVDMAHKPSPPLELLEMMNPGFTDQGPWQVPEQAAYYEAFCERSEHYAVPARAVVRLLDLDEDAHVADLGCGTGVGVQALLAALGPEGRVVGVDPASRMVEACRRRHPDERLTVRRGNAHRLRDFVPLGPGFSAVICTSAFWLERSPEAALRAIRRSLRASGQLALTMPCEYLGDVKHLTTPEALEVAQAVVAVRSDLGLSSAGAQGDADAAPTGDSAADALLLGSTDRLVKTLELLGYTDVRSEIVEREWTVSEYLDWMGQPVVVGGLLPEADDAQRREFLQALASRLDGDKTLTARWTLVLGRRA